MKIRIYLKSGQILPDLECEEFTTKSNNLTGELTSVKCEGALIPRPMYLRLEEISAIVRVDEEE